ncbi:hypothetical protein HYS91_02380 [Candidatus Daviesbacteria bacterium]|nr:hypothetical protein [Candidatus Daviesbacteria bacterium]
MVTEALITINPFQREFLIPRAQIIATLPAIQAEISQERANWQQSRAATALADSVIEVYQQMGRFPIPFPENLRQELIRREEAGLYGEIVGKSTLYAVSLREAAQLPKKHYDMLKVLEQLRGEHSREYKGAIRNLTEEDRQIRETLVVDWRSFVAQNRGLSAFVEFLTDEALAPTREENKPFLEALARHRAEALARHQGEMMEAVKREVRDDMLRELSLVSFKRFLERFINTNSGKGPPGNVLDWLVLVSDPESGIDALSILNKINKTGRFPTDLKTPFGSFLDAELTEIINLIRPIIASYYNPPSQKQRVIEFRQPKQRQQKGSLYAPDVIIKGELEPVAQTPKTPYDIILPGDDKPASDEELRRFLEKTAKGLAKDGYRQMLEGLEKITDNLREDAHGLGVGVLTNQAVTSPAGRRVPLWHLRPWVRLKELTKEQKDLRPVYYFDQRNFPHCIFLMEITPHDKLDSNYSS